MHCFGSSFEVALNRRLIRPREPLKGLLCIGMLRGAIGCFLQLTFGAWLVGLGKGEESTSACNYFFLFHIGGLCLATGQMRRFFCAFDLQGSI